MAPSSPDYQQMNSYSNARIGPRAKCDQVVYEAIAKAAEIIVRGRCAHIPSPTNSINANNGRPNSNNNSYSPFSSRTSMGSSGSGGSSSRFNLEVEEVEMVRYVRTTITSIQ